MPNSSKNGTKSDRDGSAFTGLGLLNIRIFKLFYLKGRQRKRVNLLFTDSFPKWLQEPNVEQAKAWSQRSPACFLTQVAGVQTHGPCSAVPQAAQQGVGSEAEQL